MPALRAAVAEELQGYSHRLYAHSLSAFGEPTLLQRAGGWLLRRHLPHSEGCDAMGCYPLFTCTNWRALDSDLNEAGADCISVALVTDPFADIDEAHLRKIFPDVMRHYKDHFVIDLHKPADAFISRKRQKRILRLLSEVEIDVVEQPVSRLDEWCEAYGHLVRRHHITSLRAFSREAFAIQLAMPGMTMLRATQNGRLLGMHLYVLQGDVAHSHLGAYTDEGYALGVTHALDWASLEVFAPKARWINLGAGAGAHNAGDDGLTAYKRSWSTDTRPVYFCGRIFDRRRYDELSRVHPLAQADYFPQYRAGEFR